MKENPKKKKYFKHQSKTAYFFKWVVFLKREIYPVK